MNAEASTIVPAAAALQLLVLGCEDAQHLRDLLPPSCSLRCTAEVDTLSAVRIECEPDALIIDASHSISNPQLWLAGIRECSEYRALPAIVISDLRQIREPDALYNAGIADHIVLPVSARELTARIQSAVRLSRASEDSAASMRLSVDRFREMADNSPMMIWVANADGDITFFNRLWSQFTGVPAEQALGLRWFDVLHPEDRARTIDAYVADKVAQQSRRLEYRMRRADGEYLWAVDTAAPYFDELGHYQGCIGSVIDITERKHIEEGLLRAKLQLEKQVEERTAERDQIWHVSSELMAVFGHDGYLRAHNPAWSRLLGYDEATLQAQPFRELVHPDDMPSTAEVLVKIRRGETVTHFEHRIRDCTGNYRWIAWTAAPGNEVFYTVGRDITEGKERAAALQRAEAQLRQAQKMEAVGHLTGGVAHDFNNLLTVVIGNLDSIQRHLPTNTSERILRDASRAMEGATRAASLTQRLLAFARRQPLDPREIDVNRLVGGMTEMLTRTLGESIEIETVLAANLWPADVDPNQLENALLNLAVNARDAITGNGKLIIETTNAYVDAKLSITSELQPGCYVVIAVSDTGTGMSRETMEHVFEPFFTTKESGHGTGLGLSQVYGFAKQSGGHVKIYSELNTGTRVRLYLPRSTAHVQFEEVGPKLKLPNAPGNETILVVEDDDAVRAYSCDVLRELGYRVIEAEDGPTALTHIQRDESIALLFTDVGLPRLNGRELAREALQLRPSLKILFTSGYAREAIACQGRLDAGITLINKPFTYAELATKVREVIDGD